MPTKAHANAAQRIEVEMAAGIIAAMPIGTQRGDVTVCLDIAAKFSTKTVNDGVQKVGVHEIIGIRH